MLVAFFVTLFGISVGATNMYTVRYDAAEPEVCKQFDTSNSIWYKKQCDEWHAKHLIKRR